MTSLTCSSLQPPRLLKKLEGLPLNGPKVQADLLTKEQMKIMVEELRPLFTK